MISILDQIGEKVALSDSPERIISLVPSQTELLYDLGLNQQVIGITKFCFHPAAWHRQKVKIGGTKKISHQLIKNLLPDLIIANKEENTKEDILTLREFCPVYTSDIQTLDQAYRMMGDIGALTNRIKQAERLTQSIQEQFSRLKPSLKDLRAAYLIWKNPYMAAGNATFIHHILELTGMKNVFEHLPRYPQVPIEVLQLSAPDVILLSSEPYPFSDKHISDFRLCFPDTKIVLVNGEMFSWYGSRLQFTGQYLAHLADILR
jgi:ABC-type Fe3+-hydroxamate transport system substrate-binding protein